MPMVSSQVFKSVNFTKLQKSTYLENKTLFFLQIKKLISYTSRATLWQNSFVAEATFKTNKNRGCKSKTKSKVTVIKNFRKQL